MKKVGIIGLGTITKYYLEGLKDSSKLQLVCVCDALCNPASKEYYLDYPFYQDYKQMIHENLLDYIIISTPPATHFEIAKYALNNNVNVIIEKPATTSLADLDYLYNLARTNNLIFEIMYHWQNGIEVKEFLKLYDPKKITKVHTQVLDPYSSDGITIDELKVKLLGAWVDSGVNILSMLKLMFPFKDVSIKNYKVNKCKKTNLPIMIDVNLLIDNVEIEIIVDWQQHQNKKESYVIYDNRLVIIDHSNQSIIDGDKIMKYDDMIRLQRHYYNYFKNYNESANYEDSYLIHKLLFEVKDII